MSKLSKSSTEVATHMSFDTIRYSQLWEDSDILTRSLEIQPNDVVLSISSSGCNALALLLKEPKKVFAVDLNPAQNAVVALKLAAIKHLSHQQCLELLGFKESNRRPELFRLLPCDALAEFHEFWQQHPDIIKNGLIFEGRLDKFFKHFASEVFAKVPGIESLRTAFTTHDLPLQKSFLPAFEATGFRDAFISYFGQGMFEKGRDPAQYRYVTQDDVGRHFYERFIQFLGSTELFSNHYNHFFIYGQPLDSSLGPDYMQAKNFAALQRLLLRLEIKTATIETAIAASEPMPFTKANLSDIFEYMSPANMESLLRSMSEKMPTGSRIAFWNLLVDRPLPSSLSDRFRVLPIVPGKDRVWFYKAFYVLERL